MFRRRVDFRRFRPIAIPRFAEHAGWAMLHADLDAIGIVADLSWRALFRHFRRLGAIAQTIGELTVRSFWAVLLREDAARAIPFAAVTAAVIARIAVADADAAAVAGIAIVAHLRFITRQTALTIRLSGVAISANASAARRLDLVRS